jgi:hypothetical protein
MRKGEFVRENKSAPADVTIGLYRLATLRSLFFFVFADVTNGLFPLRTCRYERVDVAIALFRLPTLRSVFLLPLPDVTIGLVFLLSTNVEIRFNH